MLVGLAAKNGILIVEFANQLRDAGQPFDEALIEAASIRLRPIMMTGDHHRRRRLPLILSFGAGAETRGDRHGGVLAGVLVSALLTLFVIPVLYSLLARNTGSPGDVTSPLTEVVLVNCHWPGTILGVSARAESGSSSTAAATKGRKDMSFSVVLKGLVEEARSSSDTMAQLTSAKAGKGGKNRSGHPLYQEGVVQSSSPNLSSSRGSGRPKR
jgi:hypothetical protein